MAMKPEVITPSKRKEKGIEPNPEKEMKTPKSEMGYTRKGMGGMDPIKYGSLNAKKPWKPKGRK